MSKSKYREEGDKLIEDYTTETNTSAEEKKAEVDTQVDGLIQKAVTETEAQKRQATHDYNEIVDTAAIQREIDRKQVAETMANMGLTNAGLNATQQTAIQLSAGNKMAAADRQRQAAVDALTKSLQDYKFEAESAREQQKQAIDDEAAQSIAEYSATVNKNVADAEATEAKARAAAQEAAAKRNDTVLKTLLDSGAISAEVYAYALEAGLTPSAALSLQSGGGVNAGDTSASGDSWSWSTTAYRKTGKDTKNWGKFLGFIGDAGIDENDYVEYYDSNGQKKIITLKGLYDNLVNEGNMTPDQATDFINKFNRYDDNNQNYFISINPEVEDFRTEIVTTLALGPASEEKINDWFVRIYSSDFSANEKRALLEAAGITDAEIQRFIEKYK